MKTDRIIAHATYILGAALLVSLGIIGLLAYGGKPIPDVLQNIAVGSLTAEAALLVRSSNGPAPQGPETLVDGR